MGTSFTSATGPRTDIIRRQAILKAHPEIKGLMGRNPWSAACVAVLVIVQWAAGATLAYLEADWLVIILTAYLFGAFANHALNVLYHECTHNLVFEAGWANKLLGILCDFALVFPTALSFRKYHLLHHKYLGHHELDPDIVGPTEARLVGRSWWKKTLWLALFALSQSLRPLKVKSRKMWDRWIVVNIVTVVLVDVAIWFVAGPSALGYLALSTAFALGLHPLGGRWIQEHYVTEPGQETYSYYGPLNKVCFNMGYHNEHHDFANVPWNNLPKVRAAAPEYYDSLRYYRSWTWVVWNFITNPAMSAYSRIVRGLDDRPVT
jgi:sphingolipid delta-4 desaturase